MTDRDASFTARGVAVLRAAHLLIDGEPPILNDSVIGRLLGPQTEQRIRDNSVEFESRLMRGLRSHVLLRSRFAEDSLRDAVADGIAQYVLLGAGLDTFAYRQPEWARAISVIEVDHPASQRAKRDALAAAGIDVPMNVSYADIDFERETLDDGLERCGVSRDQLTFFSWLGVTMYLTREAIDAVLATVAKFPKGSRIVLTYAQPREPGEPNPLAEGAATAGEPWISYFTPEELTALLYSHGLTRVEMLARDEAMERYYGSRSDGLEVPRRVSLCTATV